MPSAPPSWLQKRRILLAPNAQTYKLVVLQTDFVNKNYSIYINFHISRYSTAISNPKFFVEEKLIKIILNNIFVDCRDFGEV